MGRYRYGFNGKENDNEVKGVGDQIDYGMRMYDPRVGRFMSVDPLTKKYPFYTPYSFAGNMPVWAIDLDGKEPYPHNSPEDLRHQAEQYLTKVDATRVSRMQTVSATPTLDKVQQFQKEQYRVERWRDLGYNDDGSESAWMRLAKNKTFKNLAGNIVLPTLDVLSIYDGAGTVKALFKGGLEQVFKAGGTKLISSEMIAQYPKSLTYGNPLETFVAPTNEINKLLAEGIGRQEIATRLGITDPNFLKGDLIRIDITTDALKNLNLRTASGMEVGANSSFVPGGKTVGRISEGVVNGISKDASGVSTSIVEVKK